MLEDRNWTHPNTKQWCAWPSQHEIDAFLDSIVANNMTWSHSFELELKSESPERIGERSPRRVDICSRAHHSLWQEGHFVQPSSAIIHHSVNFSWFELLYHGLYHGSSWTLCTLKFAKRSGGSDHCWSKEKSLSFLTLRASLNVSWIIWSVF